MAFLTPIWLLMLVPWLALVAWVLFGRADFARVSSTQFWEKDQTTAAPMRGIRLPPWPIAAVLVAILLAVLAAGGLTIDEPIHDEPFTLIVDYGVLTAAGLQKDQETVRLVRGRAGPVDVVGAPPSGEIFRTDQSGLYSVLGQPVPSGVDTTDLLPQVIRQELLRTEQQIVVVTGQSITSPDARVSIVSPQASIQNAGIEAFAVVTEPSRQAMVRIWNGFATGKAALRVDAVQIEIDLPPAGEARDYFVDLPQLGDTARAELVLLDDLPWDNVAYLAKTGLWPRVEARSAVPPAVGRMIDVYSRERPSGTGANVVTVAADPGVKGQITLTTGSRKAGGVVHADLDHPVTKGVDWNAILKEAMVADPPGDMPQGKVLLSVGETPVIIENAERRLWVGLDLTDFARRPDFVVFFTNAIDYAGQGRQRYAAERPRALDSAWQRIEPVETPNMHAAPGIYRNGTQFLAQWIPAVHPPAGVVPANPQMPRWARPAGISAAPALLLASILLTLTASLRLTRK